MFAVRFHGRGGQGVVTAAELLASAAFREDRYAQAFPSFGSERMGAPVMSFCRMDDKPIRTREPVMEPDALLIQDATLLHQQDLFAGLRSDGYVLVNSPRDATEVGLAAFAERFSSKVAAGNSAAARAAFEFVTDELTGVAQHA
jgi:pyruvate ferredoxin oxidoreductase gamma subunit